MNRLKNRHILFIIAHEIFRDEEYQIPHSIFENEGASITVASTQLSPATGKSGFTVIPDILVKDVKPENYDAVVFVGGAGSKKYWDNSDAHSIARGFNNSNKLTTAICSAPVTLAYAEILKGKKATCFPDDKAHLKKNNSYYLDEEVVIDGNIITGRDYRASEKFGKAVLKELLRKG